MAPDRYRGISAGHYRITHFCILFVRLFRGSRKQALRAAALILVVVAAGQGIKVAMKNTIKEPRPYVVWLAQQHIVPEKGSMTFPGKRGHNCWKIP